MAVHHVLVNYGFYTGTFFGGEVVLIGILMLVFEYTSFWCKGKFLLRTHNFSINVQMANSVILLLVWFLDRIVFGVYVNLFFGSRLMFIAWREATTWYFGLIYASYIIIMCASQYMHFYWGNKWYSMVMNDYL